MVYNSPEKIVFWLLRWTLELHQPSSYNHGRSKEDDEGDPIRYNHRWVEEVALRISDVHFHDGQKSEKSPNIEWAKNPTKLYDGPTLKFYFNFCLENFHTIIMYGGNRLLFFSH